jgi:hypothetical protein
MENRNSNNCGPAASFGFRVSSFVASALALAACGTPGAPTPPRPVVPEAVSDLSARQIGSSVVLTFTLPRKSAEGELLSEPPQIEIHRGVIPAGAKPADDYRPPLVLTIPSALVETYVAEGRVQYADPVRPEMTAGTGDRLVYGVKTRVSKRRSSELSNLVSLRVFPVPAAVSGLSASVSPTAINLQWTPATEPPGAAVVNYRVYRAEVEPGAEAEAASNPAQAKLLAAPALLAVAPSASYADTQIEFGKAYLYVVRAAATYDAEQVESADSSPAVVLARDTFPPAPPQNLIAILVPAGGDAPARIELSWSISPEPDVAGYQVYRAEPEGTSPQKISRELLPVPAFRDMWVEPGKRYTYTVTAVDRAGNESGPSAPVSESTPGKGGVN